MAYADKQIWTNGQIVVSDDDQPYWVSGNVHHIHTEPSVKTFGYTTIGGSGSYKTNFVRGCEGTPTSDGEVTSMSVYVANNWTSGEKMKLGLFDSSGNLLAETIERSDGGTSGTWQDFTFSSNPTVTADTKYLLGFLSDNNIQFRYDTAIGESEPNQSTTYPNFPDPVNVSTGYQFSIYATYTESGTGYTLTADTASFTITGISTGLPITRKVVADTNAFAFLGMAMELAVIRKLIPETRSFTFTGITAGLSIIRKIAPEVGVFTLTGIAAGLAITHKILAETGAVVLTGIEVTLGVARKIVASATNFALTGIQTAIKRVYQLSLDSSSFILAGIDIGFISIRKLIVDTASFTLLGSDSILSFVRKFVTETASFSLEGTAVAIVYNQLQDYTLIAETVAFNLVGKNNILKFIRKIMADVNNFNLIGIDALVSRLYTLLAELGGFTMLGKNAITQIARKMQLSAGTFIFTGVIATLRKRGKAGLTIFGITL